MVKVEKKKIVCFGGGTGMPSLLSGLKNNPWLDIYAVVNMFDTGGSSGELRDKFGTLPQGDVLKCVLALSRHETAAREILLKRIRNHSYNGHTGGNILLLGLEKVYGKIDQAVDALSQLLSAEGKVIPVTYNNSNLCAKYLDGTEYKSETSIDIGIYEGKRVEKIFLYPEVEASTEAIEAINNADVICLGPGSFYTSVLPNLLPVGIKEAIIKSKAPIIYIMNLLTEGAGMQEETVHSLTQIAETYTGRKIDKVIVNSKIPNNNILEKYSSERKYPITITNDNTSEEKIILADLWEDGEIARHDPQKLSHVVFDIIASLNLGK